MSVDWTKDQEKAISSTEKGTVVSAAAGSGKTTVLIERIIRMLSDEKKKIPADRLLAVTFTNDAAAQMRDKLNDAFEKAISSNPGNEWLLNQQNLLQLAKISTINSFCLELVKDNLHELDFQGGLKILDDAQANEIISRAIRKALDNLCGKNAEDYNLLYTNFGADKESSDEGVIFTVVKSLYTFLRSLPFREDWIESARNVYTSADAEQQMIDLLFEDAQKILVRIRKYTENYRFLLNKDIDLPDKTIKISFVYPKLTDIMVKLNDTYSECENVLGIKENGVRDYDALSNLEIKFPSIPSRSKEEKFLPEDVLEFVKDLKKEMGRLKSEITSLYNEIKSLFAVPQEKIGENIRLTARIFDILCEVVTDAEKISMEEKIERNSVEFSDVELMAKDLLVKKTENGYERTDLANEIRNSHIYEIIMIDEFQDVNNLQELIFRAISDSDDVTLMGKNLFVVGDVKQAIYQFRLTNPKLFTFCREQAEKKENSDKLEAIYLKENFRSRREVVEFVNFLFRNIMSVQAGSVTYDKNECLIKGAAYSDRKVPVEVMLIKGDDSTEKKEQQGYSDENLFVAKRIKELIDSGEPVYRHGKDVPCKASDICVLVQGNKEIKAMSNALEAVGLHAQAEDISGYMKSREIVFVLNVLRVIDNPMNDNALVGLLLSHVKDLSFTPDELSILKLKNKEKNKYDRHFFQILSASKSDKDTSHEKESDYIDMGDEKLQEKCKRAFAFVDTLRFYAMSMTMDKLIRKIYDMTDLMGITSLYLDSDKKRANLHLLLEYAQAYEKNSNEGVSGFLRYIDSVSSNDKAFAQAVTTTAGGDAVYVKTYHKSKGLEYPFVFLCQLNKDFFTKDKGYIYLDNEKGVAFQLADKPDYISRINPYYRKLKNICQNEARSEKLRLLYVGCTRAKEKLFISYFARENDLVKSDTSKRVILKEMAMDVIDKETISPDTVLSYNNMLAWFTLALTKYPNNKPFLDFIGVPQSPDSTVSPAVTDPEAENVDIVFRHFDASENDESAESKLKREYAKPDPEIERQLMEKFSFEYDYEYSKLPSKLAVTEIVKQEKEKEYKDKNPEFFPNLPRLDEELDKLTAAEKGTFTHKFMELADYSNAEKNVTKELDRLCREGYFTKKEASGVYIDSLEKFFRTEFYKRMKNSQEIMREKKFLVSMKDLKLPEKYKGITGEEGMIQGIADCIFKEDDGYVIVDYKTDKFVNPDEMLKYGTQLAIYKAAFELILDEKIKSCYIYSFYLREGKEIPL